jgi:DNA-binding GntR family transcriptional regulator
MGNSCGDRRRLPQFAAATLLYPALTADLRIARLAMTKECFSSEQAYRGHVGEIVREHRELIEAIRDRDGDRSEVARSHADLARKRVSESLTQIMTPAMEVRLGELMTGDM